METVIMLLNNSLPKNWVISCIGDVYRVLESGSRPSGGVKAFSEGTPSIGAEHINNWGGFNFTHLRYVPDEFASTVRRGKIELEDILIVKDGATTGRVAFVNKDFPYLSAILNEHVFRLRVNTEIINQKLLFYYLYSQVGQKMILSSFHGAAQGGINQQFIKSVFIPHPVSEKDQLVLLLRIETLLHQLTEARRLHEKIVADTNRLMDAILAEYFPKFEVALPEGWEWKPISFLAHDTDRQNPTTTAPNKYFNYIDISSVDNSIGSVTNPKSLLGQDAPSRARKIIHTNDVIFATTRPYLKNIALIPPELDQSICSTGFCVLVPKVDNCVPQYLYYAARSESVIQQLIPKQRGASYPAVLDQDIFSSFIPIPYPSDPTRSKTSQQIIAKRITEMGESVSEAQLGNTKTGALLNQMEQSILAQAFRGEL